MSVFRFGTVRSPPRRQGSEQSPFCTSPSQLQEVTLDSNASANGTMPFSMGVRSPGKSSPIRGRTMKEYEELSQLKKENFNLKLRIYFLEERMGHMNSPDDKEDPVKKNIELKVEAESLRKEVSDKQELLCQASKAMDLLEEQHRGEIKKIQEERDAEKEMMECKISELESELKEYATRAKELNFTRVGDNTLCEAFGLNVTRCVDRHTHEEVENLQQQKEELESQVQQLENALHEEAIRSSQLEEELQEAQQEAERVNVRCQGLELELKQRDGKLEDLLQELEQKGQDLAGSNLRIRTLEEALSAKEPEIQIKVQELCERDRIIEEKQNQIEQQNKVLVEIQITLDEKQRQIDSLREILAARDSTIADIEGRLAKAKASARNLEAKLDASVHEANRLREEVETLKAQQKRSNRNREQLYDLDLMGPLRRRTSNLSNGSGVSNTSDEKASPGRRMRPNLEDDNSLRKRVLELKEKEEKIKALEHSNKDTKVQLEQAQETIKSLKEKVRVLETLCQDTKNKLKESEKKGKENEVSKQLQNDYAKACLAVKSFIKQQKENVKELDQLKSEVKRKDRRIHEQTLEANELRDALNKANWEIRQQQAHARVQGGGGIPGAFEDVTDMTEEENERLWAEVEDKNKKLAQVTKERDNVSLEMEKQIQALVKSLKEKEELLLDQEAKASTSLTELEVKDNRIKELEEDVNKLKSELKSLKTTESHVDSESKSKETSKTPAQSESLVLELENKKHEVERLNAELQKRTNNLQELVNKELWDKNREIEKLQDRLSNICQRKELEIMSLQQQVAARDFQLKMLQDKVTELGMHVNLPSALMFRELQQIPVTFNQHVHYSQPSAASEVIRSDTSELCLGEVSSTVPPSKDEEASLRDQLQASLEERKFLCRKVDELREKLRNTPERDSDSRTLRSECMKLREEIERANAWRKEAGEAYALLTKRLEELAAFLNSLLTHPEQLGSLGVKRRQLLRQTIERNVELSRSLSTSFSVNSQDLNNISFAPLLDSFSSYLMSTTTDLNLSITDILRIEEVEEEIGGCDCTGTQEPQVETGSNYCRSSGSNSEIAHILGMKDSSTSEDIFSPTEKIVGEQAQVIVQLRSQIEKLTQEIKQRDIEFCKSQNDELIFGKSEASINLLGPRSRSTSPSKSSSASSGTVWKPKAEGDRLENLEEAEESLNSMIFYNSHHLNNASDLQNKESCISVEKHVANDSKLLQRVLSPEKKCVEVTKSSSSPVKTCIPSEDVSLQLTYGDSVKTTPKKQEQIKSTKSPGSFKMFRSSSASAVALSQLQQPVQAFEIPPGSHSESEAWSEPDRTVSLARIGLNEESAKPVLMLGGVNGCAPLSATRSRSSRVLPDDDDSSESSEQTAHEIRLHGSGKRVRSDTGETRRLQNRLRALEQVNEALRAELTILHQLTPPQSLPSAPEANDKPVTRDISINTTHIAKEEKLDKSTSIEPFQSEDTSSCSSVTIPVHLLEQIRYQREKLESSLFHNDFIRQQLEGIISSLSSQDGDNMVTLWQKIKETTEQMEEAQNKSQELEKKLQEMEVQLEESRQQAKLADTANEQLQITRQTVSFLQEQVTSLEVRLQEKDNEILERKCQLLELENKAKQQSIEAENVMQEAKRLKEEAETQLKTAETMKCAEESKMKEAEKIIIEAEKIKSDANDKLIELEKRLKDVEFQMKDIEMQKSKLQCDKEVIEKEKERLLKENELTQNEKESFQIQKQANDKERIKIQEEWEKLKEEKEIMKKEMDELKKEVRILTENANKQRDEAEREMKEAKRKIEEAEVKKEEAELKIKSAEEEICVVRKQSEIALKEQAKVLETRFNEKLQEEEKKLEQREWVNKSEVQRKICEAEKLGLEFAVGLKSQIEDVQNHERVIRQEAEKKIKEIEEKSKEQEAELKKRLQESEKSCREKECELIKCLEESKLIHSQAALERIRLANEKLRLEQEIRLHEAREAELIHERKEAENRLLMSKEQLEKEMKILQQQKNDLEKCVKDLETANKELRRRLRSLHIKEHLSTSSVNTEQSSGHTSGPDSTTSLTYVKHGRMSPGSYSSSLDLLAGEGGSLPHSPWGTTGPVSLGSQSDKEHCKERSGRDSDGGRSGGLTALSSMVLQHGFGRQRSELSDYMSEDQAQEYEAVITQTCSSSYWVTRLTEQHSTPSINVPVDPSSLRNINSSPDLGIESDQGRFSSLEAASSGMHAETAKVVSTLEGYGSDLDHTLAPVVINSRGDASLRSYKELEQENVVLRRRLTRTHRALEETQAQLMAATQRKKQIEREICKQLHRTHHILKKARINLEPGTEYFSPSTEELE